MTSVSAADKDLFFRANVAKVLVALSFVVMIFFAITHSYSHVSGIMGTEGEVVSANGTKWLIAYSFHNPVNNEDIKWFKSSMISFIRSKPDHQIELDLHLFKDELVKRKFHTRVLTAEPIVLRSQKS